MEESSIHITARMCKIEVILTTLLTRHTRTLHRWFRSGRFGDSDLDEDDEDLEGYGDIPWRVENDESWRHEQMLISM
jgi:hypothetical protein